MTLLSVARALVALAPAAFVIVGAAVAGSGGDDAGWELLATSMGDEVQNECFKIPELPPWAHGDFFISGPARFEKGGYRFKSLFDGYGRTNRFELRQGEACYASKWMKTNYFRMAEELGRISNGPTFYGVEPPLPPCPLKHPICFLTGAQMDNNWVYMIPVAGKGLMTTDSPSFVDMDLASLNTTGMHQWSVSPPWIEPFHAPSVGSAHPTLRPKTEATWVEILVEVPMLPFGKPAVGVYTFDGRVGAKRTLLATVPLKHMHYFHSFGVSEHYVVLPCNLAMGLPKHGANLLDAFEGAWDGIRVVDLEGRVQVFDTTEHFYHVHIANTFENATGIVMDLGAYNEIPFAPSPVLIRDLFVNKTARDGNRNLASFRRLHLHLAGPLKGKVTTESFSVPRRTLDFFKINPAVNGLPYCVYYAVEWFHDGESYASMAVLKHDLCRGTRTYWAKPDSYPGEPFFIGPRGEGAGVAAAMEEDHGLLVFITLNGRRRASDFVVLDAATFSEVAVVELPVHIPFTAHGQFIPSATREMHATGGASKQWDIAAAVGATVVV